MTFYLRLILAVFACYRLSQLISIDEGPFHIFGRLKRFLGRMAKKGKIWQALAELVVCPFCIGVWFAALLTVFVIFPNAIVDGIMIFMAIAGAQTFLQDHSSGFER